MILQGAPEMAWHAETVIIPTAPPCRHQEVVFRIAEAALTSFIAALFSMMNPIGNIGVFAGMTASRPDDEVRRTAWSSALAIAITLLIVTWAGSAVMEFFGITIDTLRAAGGIITILGSE